MSLFEELKRRRVFRLIAAYVVVAWVIIQVVTAIEEPLNLPAWFDTAVIVLLGLGFPIAVIMSWVYDVTPDGVVREDDDGARPVRIDYGKIALVTVLILGAFLAGSIITDRQPAFPPTSTQTGLRQFEISEPDNNQSTEVNTTRGVILSPDGRSIVMRARIDDDTRLYLRRLDSLELLAIKGTEGVRHFFTFSPDGQSIVFDSRIDDEIQIVPVGGGLPTPVAPVHGQIRSLSWSTGGNIVYTETPFPGLKLVSASGGRVSTIDIGESDSQYRHPSFIPGSEWLVLTIGERGTGLTPSATNEIAIMSPDGEIRMTGLKGSSPQVSSSGFLLYYSNGAVMGVPFDLDQFELSGGPVPVVDDVFYSRSAHYDISSEGTLVYRRGSARGMQRLVWVDPNGAEEHLPMPLGRYSHPEISPDGNILAVTVEGPRGPDLWTYSLGRGDATQWTFSPPQESDKVWSPDGKTLYFETGISPDVYWFSLEKPGQIEQLTDSVSALYPESISSDGRYLFVDEWSGTVADGNNFGVIDLEGDREFRYLMATDNHDSHPMISPDSTRLAYMSDIGGPLEIYVRRYPFDETGPKRATVTGNSWQPRWSENGRELFYWDRDENMFYVVHSDDFEFSEPMPLFSTANYEFDGASAYCYDATRNKFIFIKKPAPGSTADEIVLIENWQELITKRIP